MSRFLRFLPAWPHYTSQNTDGMPLSTARRVSGLTLEVNLQENEILAGAASKDMA